jgi:signal peptidase I
LVFFTGIVGLIDLFFYRPIRSALVKDKSIVDTLGLYKNKNYADICRQLVSHEFPVADMARSFFPILLLVLILRSFLLEPFKIPSSSMVPTLLVDDFILVNKFAYGLRLPVFKIKFFDVGEPRRGDVMVFFPPNDKRYFIKRVIGLPGDEIRCINNVLYINGKKMPQTPALEHPGQPGHHVVYEDLDGVVHLMNKADVPVPKGANYHTIVPEDHYFMMGDNRDHSSDSRYWGPVPEENIVGKAFAIWMHWGGWSLPSFSRNGSID